MLPIRCPRCGHVQDAGSAMAPNNICERCRTPIYGPQARDPIVMAGLSLVCTIGAWWIEMPKEFLYIACGITAILIIGAVVKLWRRG